MVDKKFLILFILVTLVFSIIAYKPADIVIAGPHMTDLEYFKNIIPCGIENKDVTSLDKETKKKITTREVEEKVIKNLSEVFGFKIK